MNGASMKQQSPHSTSRFRVVAITKKVMESPIVEYRCSPTPARPRTQSPHPHTRLMPPCCLHITHVPADTTPDLPATRDQPLANPYHAPDRDIPQTERPSRLTETRGASDSGLRGSLRLLRHPDATHDARTTCVLHVRVRWHACAAPLSACAHAAHSRHATTRTPPAANALWGL